MVHKKETNLIILERPSYETLPMPVVLRSEELAPRQGFSEHTHPWHQFVYATAGSLLVTVLSSRYVITPEQAIWIPAGMPHTTAAINGAKFRNLYVEEKVNIPLPNICTVYSTSSLLRELIIELDLCESKAESLEYVAKLHTLILDQITRLAEFNLYLPWPQSALLQRLCENLHSTPGESTSSEELARSFGLSNRTLSRRFEKETGITLREWRQKLRLFVALQQLSSARNMTEIAMKLGYSSVSAFSYMFREEMGCTPSEWKNRQSGWGSSLKSRTASKGRATSNPA